MTKLLLNEVYALTTYLLSLPEDKTHFNLDELTQIYRHINGMMVVIRARKVS